LLPGTLQTGGNLDETKCINEKGHQLFMHAATIIGRRQVQFTNKAGQTFPICQYLIRDSGGTNCSATEPRPFFSPSNACENGQYWVDEKTLFTNSDEIYYIPN
jgi:hypothetical protein